MPRRGKGSPWLTGWLRVPDGDRIRGAMESLGAQMEEGGNVIRLPLARLTSGVPIPADAGPYASGLAAILRRIPESWLRLINCGPGWYPLVVDLDQKLAYLDPEYTVHQVKQKFAELRYYFETAKDEAAEEMYDLTVAAAQASKSICEMCGKPGSLMHRHLTVRTVCKECGRAAGFVPAPASEEHEE